MSVERILFLTNADVFTIKEKYRFLKLKYFIKYLNYSKYFKLKGFKSLYKKINETIDEEKINTILIHGYFNSFEMEVKFIKALNKKALTVFWSYDDWTNYDFHSSIMSFYTDLHVTLSIESFYSKQKIRQRSLFLPDFYDQKHLKKRNNNTYLYDVSFIGRIKNKSNRKYYLEYLKKNNINLFIHDPNTDGLLSEEKISEIYSQSKININFSGCTTNLNFGSIKKKYPLYEIYYGFKGRLVEIALTNSFVISETFPEYELLYKNNLLPTFNSPEELVEKIKYFLLNEEERINVSHQLYEHSIENFTFEKNIQKLMQEIETTRNLKKNKNFNLRFKEIKAIKSHNYKINEIMWIYIYLLKFLITGKVKIFITSLNQLFRNGIIYFLWGGIYFVRYPLINYLKKIIKS